MGWKNQKRSVANDSSRILSKPLARGDELVVEELGDELLIYDLNRDRAHSLGAVAASVWQACDGSTSVESLSAKLEMDEETVARAILELREVHLLDTGPADAAGMTRRDLGFRAAKLSAAAASVPLIVSIAAPVAEAAATPTPAQCLLYTDSDCDNCTNICGCCCCGQAGGGPTTPSCKTCYTTSGCPTIHFTEEDKDGHCSATAKDPPKCTPAGTQYTCKDGTVVQLNGTDRCCEHKPFTT